MGFLSSTSKEPKKVLQDASKVRARAAKEGREITPHEKRLIQHHTDVYDESVGREQAAMRWRWKKK